MPLSPSVCSVVPHKSNLLEPSVPARYVVILFPLDSSQSPDEDCTLEEEEEAPVEEEDDIDQFNDDTFGAGAIGKWFVFVCVFLFQISIFLHVTVIH